MPVLTGLHKGREDAGPTLSTKVFMLSGISRRVHLRISWTAEQAMSSLGLEHWREKGERKRSLSVRNQNPGIRNDTEPIGRRLRLGLILCDAEHPQLPLPGMGTEGAHTWQEVCCRESTETCS